MEEDRPLFDPSDFPPADAKASGHTFAPLRYPLWTEHKARLIARYLYYFVMITKHGTYIDGFSGPQNDRADMWVAKLVIESEPRWLRHFHFIELDGKKIAGLQALKAAEDAEPAKPKRSVAVYHGDFNLEIDGILSAGSIKPKEAAFCLLDQRTFECHWESLQKLAAYKPVGEHKIELFYFLPIGWLDRAFAATKNEAPIVAWWGRHSWRELLPLSNRRRAELFVDRIKTELGYDSVVPWPIYEKQGSDRVMYYMIHATDHPEAPKLMRRAYNRAVDPIEPIEQLQLAFEAGTMEP
jgi:three-Cys-motif partner protein